MKRERKENPYILCIDIGTSSMKGACIDFQGNCLQYRREKYGSINSETGFHDSAIWIEKLRNLCNTLVCGNRERKDHIRAIVVSGNGPTLVPIGLNSEPLFYALLWLQKEQQQKPEQKSLFLPKVIWFKNEFPEKYNDTHYFLSCPEYLDYYLTGEPCVIVPNDAFKPYIWTEESIEAYRLDKNKFPRFAYTGEDIGKVRKKAASYLGIPEGVPVFAGGFDFLMGLLGTGTVKPGRTCDRAGTSEGINYCSETLVTAKRLRTLPHIIKDKYNVATLLSSTGLLFEWFRKISNQSELPYDTMLKAIKNIAPGGKHYKTDSKPWFFPTVHEGAIWGFSRGMFVDLGAGHGKDEMGLAVVESIGYAVREAIEVLESKECNVDALRVSGGQSKNAMWNQMKADIIGKPLLVPHIEDGELAGDACVGLVGLGYAKSLTEAAEAIIRIKSTYEPQPPVHEIYNELYYSYFHAYQRFREAYKLSQRY